MFASSADWDYGPLIDEIAAHRATEILVVVPLRQAGGESSELQTAVPDETLRRTLRQARQAGLQASLMPIIELTAPAPGTWRGVLAPARPDAWWADYTTHLLALADVAEATGVVRLVVGSEFCTLEAQAHRWETLISLIRKRFSGRLTYSANWDHFVSVPFWGSLDEVAVTAYHPVQARPLADHLAQARRFADTLGKRLVVTELGYPTLATAADRPWDEQTGAAPDERLQAELLARGLEGAREARVASVFVWNWFGRGGAGDRGFSPRGKPAARVLLQTFAAWERHPR